MINNERGQAGSAPRESGFGEQPISPEPAEPVALVEPAVAGGETATPRVEPPTAQGAPEPESIGSDSPVAVLVAPAAASETEPVSATADAASADLAPAPSPTPTPPTSSPTQTVYVPAPTPPRRRGNRGFGALIGVVAAIIFSVFYAGVIIVIEAARGESPRVDFVANPGYFVPVIFFVVGFIIFAVIINRAAWWAWVLSSVVVGLFVYFGTIGVGLLSSGVIAQTPQAAGRLLGLALANPFVIAAALLAREATMWMGAVVSARGRRVKLRIAEDRAEFEREAAFSRAELDDARRDPLV